MAKAGRVAVPVHLLQALGQNGGVVQVGLEGNKKYQIPKIGRKGNAMYRHSFLLFGESQVSTSLEVNQEKARKGGLDRGERARGCRPRWSANKFDWC